jgi:hypothetical protein
MTAIGERPLRGIEGFRGTWSMASATGPESSQVRALGRTRTTWVTPAQADPDRVVTVFGIVALRQLGS